MKNIHKGVLLLVKLHAEVYSFNNSNSPPWVFLKFFKLCKWSQVAQKVTLEIFSKLFCQGVKPHKNVFTYLQKSIWRRTADMTCLLLYEEQQIYPKLLLYGLYFIESLKTINNNDKTGVAAKNAVKNKVTLAKISLKVLQFSLLNYSRIWPFLQKSWMYILACKHFFAWCK